VLRTVAPSRNSTFVTLPSASPAVAPIVIVGFHGKTAPSAGVVIAAVGAALPAGATVIVAAPLVVVWPRSSVARAVSV
jgi:hypothetical protein